MKTAPRQRPSAIAGMTFIEVMIALGILATVLLATTGFMQVIQSASTYNNHLVVASFLTQAKVEEFNNRSYTATPALDVTTQWTPHPNPETLSGTGAVSASGYYNRQWQITLDGATGYKTIEARTRWTDRLGKVHQVSFKAVKGPN